MPEIHHGDAVADVAHHRKVVRDEQIGDAELALQPHQQVEDLRADRDVERRDRLVADDQLGRQRERARDHDALALAAGELVRIARGVLRLQPDQHEQLLDAARERRAAQHAAHQQRLADALADRHLRIERRVRVLEDDLHVALRVAQRRAVEPVEVRAEKIDLAGGRAHDAERRVAGGRLAAAAFADQREGLAGLDREAHAVDRLHGAGRPPEHAAADREVHLQVGDLEQRLAHRASSSARRSTCQQAARCALRRPAASARRLDAADVVGERAARVEAAAGCGQERRSGTAPSIVLSCARRSRVDRRQAFQQQPRVGMMLAAEQREHVALLDHASRIHHVDPVGHVGDHAHVVGDQQQPGAGLAPQPLDQREDLRLDGDVERGGRLVGDQQPRPADQRHRDHHALAHPAGELERILRHAPLRHPRCRPPPASRAPPWSAAPRLSPAMRDQRLDDLLRRPSSAD